MVGAVAVFLITIILKAIRLLLTSNALFADTTTQDEQ